MPLTESVPDALARVYAKTLFELADEAGGQDKIESVLGELDELVEIARSDHQFGEFLSSRLLSSDRRGEFIERVLEGNVSDLVYRFLRVLNNKGRLGHLAPVTAAYDQLVQQSFGRIEVDVYTAAPLDSSDLAMIRDRLRAATGKEPIVHPYIDESMIGGLKLQVGDQLIDASVATRLRRLRDQLNDRGAARVRGHADSLIDQD